MCTLNGAVVLNRCQGNSRSVPSSVKKVLFKAKCSKLFGRTIFEGAEKC
jgi:hypothetical protein